MKTEKILMYKYYKQMYTHEEFLFKLRGIVYKTVNVRELTETPNIKYLSNIIDEIYNSMSDEEKLYIELED